MFTKVLVICTVAAVALGFDYPPGINPALCPNYPYCDMELLAHQKIAIPTPEWELPYARIVAASIPAAAPVAIDPVAEPAVQYPADVDPASCPNYPYCA